MGERRAQHRLVSSTRLTYILQLFDIVLYNVNRVHEAPAKQKNRGVSAMGVKHSQYQKAVVMDMDQ